jgi:hypothetical protein
MQHGTFGYSSARFFAWMVAGGIQTYYMGLGVGYITVYGLKLCHAPHVVYLPAIVVACLLGIVMAFVLAELEIRLLEILFGWTYSERDKTHLTTGKDQLKDGKAP